MMFHWVIRGEFNKDAVCKSVSWRFGQSVGASFVQSNGKSTRVHVCVFLCKCMPVGVYARAYMCTHVCVSVHFAYKEMRECSCPKTHKREEFRPH